MHLPVIWLFARQITGRMTEFIQSLRPPIGTQEFGSRNEGAARLYSLDDYNDRDRVRSAGKKNLYL